MRSVCCLALFAGCGPSRERFEVDGIDQLCTEASRCAGTFEPGACVDLLRVSEQGCDYLQPYAHDCLEALDQGTDCEAVDPFDYHQLVVPDACTWTFECAVGTWTDPLFEGSP